MIKKLLVSIFAISTLNAMAYNDNVYVENNDDDDADVILAVSTAAVAGLSVLSISSETTEVNEAEAYHRRMIKEGRTFLRNMEVGGEMYAKANASEEFLERLAEERAENPSLSTAQLVSKVIDEEKAALGSH